MAISKLKATFLTIISSAIIVSFQDLLVFSKTLIKLNIYIASLAFLFLIYEVILVPIVFSIYNIIEEEREYNEIRSKVGVYGIILIFSISSILIGKPDDYVTMIFLAFSTIVSFTCTGLYMLYLNRFTRH